MARTPTKSTIEDAVDTSVVEEMKQETTKITKKSIEIDRKKCNCYKNEIFFLQPFITKIYHELKQMLHSTKVLFHYASVKFRDIFFTKYGGYVLGYCEKNIKNSVVLAT